MTDESVTAVLAEYVTPLSSTKPADNSGSLAALTAGFNSVDIIGLGEATHGTREFFDLKHRVIRQLVSECGFRTVALETDVANTLALDKYVRGEAGDLQAALDSIHLWVWKTQGMARLLTWLRKFNDGRPLSDQVRFHGISVSEPSQPASALQSINQELGKSNTETANAPELLREVSDTLDVLAETTLKNVDESRREELLQAGIDSARAVRSRLDDQQDEYVTARSASDWELTRHLCRHLEQSCKWNGLRFATPGQFNPDAFEQRDRLMAENVAWCLECDAGDGVIVSAHNMHVKRGTFEVDYEWAQGQTMGEFLNREYDAGYRPLGTDFARGEFRAIATEDEAEGRVPRTFSVTPPHEESVTAYLDQLENSPLFFDVESANHDARLDTWFDDQRRVRGVSALVDPDEESRVHNLTTSLAESFDGLFFVAHTVPSEPVDS